MKAAAPQAPVSSPAKTAKTRKVPGHAHPAALGHSPDKASLLFQQIMSARGARKDEPARLVAAAEGLKGSLSPAVPLKIPVQQPRRAQAHGEVPVSGVAAAAIADQEKPDAERKTARSKTAVLHATGANAAAHPGAHAALLELAKEKKPQATELPKAPVTEARAPVIEARAPIAHAQPAIRILDLRRVEKVRVSESADTRRVDGQASSARDPSADLTVRIGPAREPFAETLSKPVPVAPSSAQAPLERLREMAGSELVRASTLILKDGGGEIRLVLKPESLGSVRIRMNVVDNNIEGRIIVDSAAVKHVFDGSVDALRRALTAEGFQMGSLQVSVGGQNADPGERRRQEAAPAVRKIAAQGFERNVPGAENVSLGDLFVNLFV